MQIKHEIIEVETGEGICIHNLTPQIVKLLETTSIKTGQALIFSRHTTTALAINEDEVRLLEDIKVYLDKLAPASAKYSYCHKG